MGELLPLTKGACASGRSQAAAGVENLVKVLVSIFVTLLLTLSAALADSFPRDTRVVGVRFEPGTDTTEIADETSAEAPVMYRFRVDLPR
jgi:hypothetical protein